MMKDKTQLLRHFEALNAKQESLDNSKSNTNTIEEQEEWELVAEIHGDSEAPERFNDYAQVCICVLHVETEN